MLVVCVCFYIYIFKIYGGNTSSVADIQRNALGKHMGLCSLNVINPLLCFVILAPYIQKFPHPFETKSKEKTALLRPGFEKNDLHGLGNSHWTSKILASPAVFEDMICRHTT